MSLLKTWAPFFRSNVRMRGRSYFLARRVTQVPPQEGELIRAQVHGTRQYVVTIRGQGTSAAAHCTCPMFASGAYCKHIWATLLDVQEKGVEAASSSPDGGVPDPRAMTPPPLRARKRSGERSPARRSEPQWVGRLSLLRAPAFAPDAAPPPLAIAPQQIGYVVCPDLCLRYQGLVVELRQRHPTRTGWSPLKPLRITPGDIPNFPDAIDRELCALLLGAQRVHDGEGDPFYIAGRNAAVFRLLPGAWQMLLRRMIQTGRCFLDQAESDAGSFLSGGQLPPIHWDGHDPWVLWLVGTDTGEDLSLDLELRRGRESMPLHQPALVLGGLDGLVFYEGKAAAFDDRGATRWVWHFRDDLRRGDEAAPLRVPAADIGRFLDRLYLLPSLPEIELPEGVGLREQRVELVPHLELFSPAAGLGLEAGARNQLTARVWFAYGPYRVRPGQPERFVVAGNDQTLSGEAPLSDEDAAALAAPGNSAAPMVKTGGHPTANDQDRDDDADSGSTGTGDVADADRTMADDAESEKSSAVSPSPERTPAGRPLPPVLIRRDLRREREEVASLVDLGFRQNVLTGVNGDGGPAAFAANPGAAESVESPAAGGDVFGFLPIRLMPQAVAELLRRGWVVTADRKIIRPAGTPSFAIQSGIDWFELRGGVTYGSGASGSAGGTASGGDHGYAVSLPEILAAAKAGKSMITLSDGSQGLLPQEWLREHGLLTAVGQIEGDHLRFKASQAALLDRLLNQQELVDVDGQFAAVRRRLGQFQGVAPLDPPTTFVGTLRPYQREGLGWLGFLRWLGMGGILADDMGLGKTIQVLAMLEARYGEKRAGDPEKAGEEDSRTAGQQDSTTSDGSSTAAPAHAAASSDQLTDQPINQLTLPGESAHPGALPTLIVVPRSVIFNWIDEARRFTPGLRVQSYTGADRQSLRAAFQDHDVIVTSYGLMRRDIAELRHHRFDYVILDEAQAIKNPASQGARAARLLDAQHRLALTGTPVENHLGDLWSIFEFLNPGMLGSSALFAQMIRGTAVKPPGEDRGQANGNGNGNGNGGMNGNGDGNGDESGDAAAAPTPAETNMNPLRTPAPGAPRTLRGQIRGPLRGSEAVGQLVAALRPFILRRTKKQVLTDLPEKTEQTILCVMEPAQRSVYDQLLRHYRGTLLRQVENRGGVQRSALMVLEALLRLRQASCHPALIDPRNPGPSAKLDALMERLTDLLDEGHKALVFSQFTSMLALVRKELDARGIVYEYLDGQTRHRKKHVQRFQTDPDCPLFLISLKAGGLGLNLTAAEYVFILDPWWNPAVENQAIDRAHRIGQSRHVFAYRLICENTVEQRIAELQEKKRQLADAIIGGQENLLRTLTRDELERLLS